MFPFSVDPERDTICDVICRWSELQPDAPALVSDDKEPLSYSALAALMDDFRSVLNASGLGRGDRIGVVHSGGADMVCATLGVMSGSTAIPFNHNFQKNEFILHFESSGVTALIIESGLDSLARDAAIEIGIPCLQINNADPSITAKIFLEEMENAPPKTAGPSDFDDLAIISSTSGTTSKSKVFALGWKKVMAHCETSTVHFELGPRDCVFMFQPLYYCGPVFTCLSVLYSGGKIFVRPSFDADSFLQDLLTHQVTWAYCGPTYLTTIYEKASASPDLAANTSLRFIRAGTTRSDPAMLDKLERLFGVPILESYASSETGPITSNLIPPALNKRGTVGVPLDNAVAILGSDGSSQEPGNHGEIVIRGERVISGYENDPELNAEAFIDGWFRPGDTGFFDEDGYLTLTGRIREMINRGGEKISPAEVDAVLMTHPQVSEAATFPVRHPSLGEEVAAVVVPENNSALNAIDLRAYLLERLSGFKIPKKIVFSESIPKSDYGKVQRYKLAETFDIKIGPK